MEEHSRSKGSKMSLNGIGSLWSDSWKLTRVRFATIVEIILLPLLTVVLGYVVWGIGSFFAIAGALIMFVGWVVFIFATLATIHTIHHGTGVDESYRATASLFWPFIWLSILTSLAILGGGIMLIIPGIWLAVSVSFSRYIFVIERRKGIDALRQSKDYVKGYWWAVLGRILLLAVVLWVIAFIILVPVGLLAGRLVALLLELVIILIYTPFATVYVYTIYRNLRELKPELVDGKPATGGGFIKASAIVGLVGWVVIVLCVGVLAKSGVLGKIRTERYMMNNGPGGGYYQQMQEYGSSSGSGQ